MYMESLKAGRTEARAGAVFEEIRGLSKTDDVVKKHHKPLAG